MVETKEEVERKIELLKVKLLEFKTIDELSVRGLAKRAGISTGTAARVKKGDLTSVAVASRLNRAGLLPECPVCGPSIDSEAEDLLRSAARVFARRSGHYRCSVDEGGPCSCGYSDAHEWLMKYHEWLENDKRS